MRARRRFDVDPDPRRRDLDDLEDALRGIGTSRDDDAATRRRRNWTPRPARPMMEPVNVIGNRPEFSFWMD